VTIHVVSYTHSVKMNNVVTVNDALDYHDIIIIKFNESRINRVTSINLFPILTIK